MNSSQKYLHFKIDSKPLELDSCFNFVRQRFPKLCDSAIPFPN